ncbi:rhamnosyl/mannosyltransferase [Prevotella sp. ne3005]|uniref:glycosyltransferase n=1 Tax=Prevotella sp. ne3005 TaxID=1761887 RepID=UPI0008AC3744|nr:glycosyltransferase [Prevotella sp. ne3005]SEM54163.1 rhamnosyl/mannosyltransferase [Prevotella sp. ne3005]
MKILQISNYYFPHIGGIEKTAQYLAEGMTDFETQVVCFGENGFTGEIDVNGIHVHKMKVNKTIASQAISLEYYGRLRTLLKEFKPDIIFLHAPNPFLYAILLLLINKRTKLAILWHSDIIKQGRIYKFIKGLEHKIINRADLIMVTSPTYRDCSIPLRNYRHKVKVLPSAIDINVFKKVSKDLVDKIKSKYSKPIVFFVGRHVPYKGIEYLVEAEKYIKSDCVIVVAGDGPLTPQLKSSANDRIKFIGRISDSELRAYLDVSSVFAFPSITRNEAFGLALVEAMYCRCVPVTFTIKGSGVNWVSIDGETGLEVENSNYKRFAQAIDSLLMDAELRDKLAENAHRRVIEKYTVECEVRLAKEYMKNLQEN